MQIGSIKLASNVILAPMAGVSDLPFREISLAFGVGMAVSEMISANPRLQQSRKSVLRTSHRNESGVRSVQIVGTDPGQMASSARYNVENGAQIIDINMGCPAKKVCNKQAGSALLRDELLVGRILDAVVKAVNVPVTLKIRTGWSPQERNAIRIARIAEQSGISAITIHGRTRACAFKGEAEYDTIAEVKNSISVPVIANGDINSVRKAREVLAYTEAEGIMIGRAAQGNPWLLEQINQGLNGQKIASPPPLSQVGDVMIRHLKRLHAFYGENAGVRIARKHLGWYCNRLPDGQLLRTSLMHATCASEQFDLLNGYFDKYDNRLLIAA